MPLLKTVQLLEKYEAALLNGNITNALLQDLLNENIFNPTEDEAISGSYEGLKVGLEFVALIAPKLAPEALHDLVRCLLSLEKANKSQNVLARLFFTYETVHDDQNLTQEHYKLYQTPKVGGFSSKNLEISPEPSEDVPFAEPQTPSTESAIYPWNKNYIFGNFTKRMSATISSNFFGSVKPAAASASADANNSLWPLSENYRKGNIIERVLGKEARRVMFGKPNEEKELLLATTTLIDAYAEGLQDGTISDNALLALVEEGMDSQMTYATIEFVQMVAPTLTPAILHRLVERLLVLEKEANPIAFLGNITNSFPMLFLAYETARDSHLAQAHYAADALSAAMSIEGWKDAIIDSYAIELIKKTPDLWSEDHDYSRLLNQLQNRISDLSINPSEAQATYVPSIIMLIAAVQKQKVLGTVGTVELISVLTEVDSMVQNPHFAVERQDAIKESDPGLLVTTLQAVIPHQLTASEDLQKQLQDVIKRIAIAETLPVEEEKQGRVVGACT